MKFAKLIVLAVAAIAFTLGSCAKNRLTTHDGAMPGYVEQGK
ncbi:MAG: putative small secreted protein [Verrucomicrobiales bacterium]|jgi:predicted small secreted protein